MIITSNEMSSRKQLYEGTSNNASPHPAWWFCAKFVNFGVLYCFPCYFFKHGGGTFLIPYLVALCVVGYPMLIMEIGIGQQRMGNSITIWTNIHSSLRNMGKAIILVKFLMICFSSAIISLSFHSLVLTMNSEVSKLRRENKTVNVNVIVEPIPDFTDLLDMPLVGRIIIQEYVTILAFVLFWIWAFRKNFKGLAHKCSNSAVHKVVLNFALLLLAPLYFSFYYHSQLNNSGLSSFAYITSIEFRDMLNLEIWVDAVVQVFYTLGLVHDSWITFGSGLPLYTNYFLSTRLVVINSFIFSFMWVWGIAAVVIPNALHAVKSCTVNKLSGNDFEDSIYRETLHKINSTDYDVLIASRKLDESLVYMNISRCTMENQFMMMTSDYDFMMMALEKIIEMGYLNFNYFPEPYRYVPLIMFNFISLHSLSFSIMSFIAELSNLNFLKNSSTLVKSVFVCITIFIGSLAYSTVAYQRISFIIIYTEITSALIALALVQVLVVLVYLDYARFLMATYIVTGRKVGRFTAFIFKHLIPLILVIALFKTLFIGVQGAFQWWQTYGLFEPNDPIWSHSTKWIFNIFIVLFIILTLILAFNIEWLNVKNQKSMVLMKMIRSKSVIDVAVTTKNKKTMIQVYVPEK